VSAPLASTSFAEDSDDLDDLIVCIFLHEQEEYNSTLSPCLMMYVPWACQICPKPLSLSGGNVCDTSVIRSKWIGSDSQPTIIARRALLSAFEPAGNKHAQSHYSQHVFESLRSQRTVCDHMFEMAAYWQRAPTRSRISTYKLGRGLY
jgi:hypothetical protein